MDLKKSKPANLEHRSTMRLIIGIIVTLTFVLAGFEWTSRTNAAKEFSRASEISPDEILIPVTRREEPKPEPRTELPKVMEVLQIVPDDVELDDIEFDFEVTDDTEYDYFNNLDDEEEEEVSDENEIFVWVQEMPRFNGGDPQSEFRKYIAQNLKYPEIAAENGVSGRVIVQFVIDKSGTLMNAEIIRGIDPALDEEALRVVNSSPKWTPGKQRTKPVNVRFIFPISFVLQ